MNVRMATAISFNEEPCGYPKEIFDTAIDSKYLCGRCELILKSPLQSFCGHRFCHECFEFLLKNSAGEELTCNLCTLEDTVNEYSKLSKEQTFPDNALKREFLKLVAHCQFPGCTWSGLFKDFETHYTSCEFRSVSQDKGISGSFPEAYNDLFTRIVSTEKSVTDLIGRVDKVEQDLEKVPVEGRGEGSSAMEISSVSSSSASSTEAAELQQTEKKMEIFEGILAVLGRELEKYSDEIQGMNRQDRLYHNRLDTVGKNAEAVNVAMLSKDDAIENVEKKISSLDQASYDGTLLWKISDFQRRRMEAINGQATSFYSPPFYTSKTGYKMCARIYLNGDGMGKGTHVSLFFVVMRGLYDNLLKWPFRQKVTLTFVDQNQRSHVADSFRPDPTSSSFKQPTSEMNIASGCPLFMQLSLLDSTQNAYVRDNTAFIKIVVSLEGLN